MTSSTTRQRTRSGGGRPHHHVRDRLTNSNDSIFIIAPSLGYESESAFSTAFKRVMGCSPRQYVRERGPDALRISEEPASASRLETVAS